MVDEQPKSLKDLVRSVGRYPEEAFLFVRDGLSFAAEHVHGPETEAHKLLQHYLAKNDMDWDDLIRSYHTSQLPESVAEVIEAAGGCENLNRHVSGRELCWALRDYAQQRWGLLARTVLNNWNVRSTSDFGRIVFGFIDFDMMRKREDDSLDDFKDVYNFDEVFEESYQREHEGNGHNGNGGEGQ